MCSRGSAVLGRGERGQRLRRLLGELLGHGHLHGDDQVPGGVLAFHPATPDPELASGCGARRHLQGHRCRQGGHGQGGTQGQLREGHRNRQGEIVAGPGEQLVRGHVNNHEQVAGRAATGAGLALAGQSDLLSVSDSRRNAGGQRPALHDGALAVAGRARVVDDRSGAAAVATRLGERERALVARDQAGSVADRAVSRRRCPVWRRCRGRWSRSPARRVAAAP